MTKNLQASTNYNAYEALYRSLKIYPGEDSSYQDAEQVARHLGMVYNTMGTIVKDLISLLKHSFPSRHRKRRKGSQKSRSIKKDEGRSDRKNSGLIVLEGKVQNEKIKDSLEKNIVDIGQQVQLAKIDEISQELKSLQQHKPLQNLQQFQKADNFRINTDKIIEESLEQKRSLDKKQDPSQLQAPQSQIENLNKDEQKQGPVQQQEKEKGIKLQKQCNDKKEQKVSKKCIIRNMVIIDSDDDLF